LNADIVIFQEMETSEEANTSSRNIQLDWVLDNVDGNTASAVGNPSDFPVTQPILFKESLYILEKLGFFFFSDNPDVIYSKPWSGRWPAFTTWVLIRNLSDNKELYIYNVHLDAFSRKNRTRGINLVMNRIHDRLSPDIPVILAAVFIWVWSESLRSYRSYFPYTGTQDSGGWNSSE